MLSEILELHSKGLAVFPVDRETKTPVVRWGELQYRLTTPEEVRGWFATDGFDVGVTMGPTSGLLLLDFDFSKHPEANEFYAAHVWPLTWEEETRSGGRHLYFKWSDDLNQKQTNTTSLIAKGVDTKGHGGYAKISPSMGYRWINPPAMTPLATIPPSLLALLPAKGYLNSKPLGGSVRPANWLIDALDSIKEGNRNETFTKVAGSLRARGYSAEEIFALLADRAGIVGFSAGELQTICNSVGRYAPSVQTAPQKTDNISAFLEDIEVVDWIVPSLVARKAIGFVAGLPETLKTWALIDLAVECARGGGSWLGKFPVNAARVLFVDQERFKGETQRRFREIIRAKGVRVNDLERSLFVRCGTSTRIDQQNSYDAFRRELQEIKPELVIVDSFATFHTKEENSWSEIQIVLERIKSLRTEFGCTFVFIAHENKGVFHAKEEGEEPSAFRMSGSTAKPAAAEFIFTVRKQDVNTSMFYHTKSTLASAVAPFVVAVNDVKDGIEVRAL